MLSDEQSITGQSESIEIENLTTGEAKAILSQIVRSPESSFDLDFTDFNKLNYGDTGHSTVDTIADPEGENPRPINATETIQTRDKRFPEVSLEDTDKFLAENINKNTLYKTKTDMKIFQDWLVEAGEDRDFQDIPAKDMDNLLARFCLGVRKRDKTEYEPDSITGMVNSIER